MAECHDAFTICEILHYEAMGLCPIGEGAELVTQGETALGGRIPINPSGGLLSRGHPVGATGLAQIHEVVTQLRHEAGKRQVEEAEGRAGSMHGRRQGRGHQVLHRGHLIDLIPMWEAFDDHQPGGNRGSATTAQSDKN